MQFLTLDNADAGLRLDLFLRCRYLCRYFMSVSCFGGLKMEFLLHSHELFFSRVAGADGRNVDKFEDS